MNKQPLPTPFLMRGNNTSSKEKHYHDKAIVEESEEFQIKPWFYHHTLSEKTNHHNNKIFRDNKLADSMWTIREYLYFLIFLRRD